MAIKITYSGGGYVGAPYAKGSSTSKAAAVAILPTMGTKRRLVYDCIREYSTNPKYNGLTDEEVQKILHLTSQSETPRRLELVAQGLVKDSGKTRQTISGNWAAVWIATEVAP
jgi:hypothetical protein